MNSLTPFDVVVRNKQYTCRPGGPLTYS